MSTRIVQKGRFEGETFELEGTIEEVCGNDCLPSLMLQGNMAAYNAIQVDGYTIDDAPFYYGKIGSLGYILSEEDLKLKDSWFPTD